MSDDWVSKRHAQYEAEASRKSNEQAAMDRALSSFNQMFDRLTKQMDQDLTTYKRLFTHINTTVKIESANKFVVRRDGNILLTVQKMAGGVIQIETGELNSVMIPITHDCITVVPDANGHPVYEHNKTSLSDVTEASQVALSKLLDWMESNNNSR